MSNEDETPWRPLGVDTEEAIATYDALHEGVPEWLVAALAEWVKSELTDHFDDTFDRSRASRMCLALRISCPQNIGGFEEIIEDDPQVALDIADYLVANPRHSESAVGLEEILSQAGSVWTVGTRSGKPGLTRRLPEGVQLIADHVMDESDRAGRRLAEAWEALHGVTPNPSRAYALAIKAVEAVAIPAAIPRNQQATLGQVISHIQDTKSWALPMQRESNTAPSGDVLLNMLRMLWHCQHDRHEGQPSAPSDVSFEEAQVAVSLAVPLVYWFTAGLAAKPSDTPKVSR